jgi:response regulator of citrate/malate metabolism
LSIVKVLLVEDDPIVVQITREFLKSDPDFMEVGVARTGSEAVELAAKLDPQLVLLDNYLPDFNGTMVIEKIRSLNNRVDFIVITAAREIPIVQECLRLGIRDYLIKPFLKQRFLQSLQNYKQFLKTLDQTEVSQADIDQINLNRRENNLPKGFSRLTQDKIREIVENRANGVTAEEIAGLVGISVVAARRYLKLLHENRVIDCDLVYGGQGRPTYIYRHK